MIGAQHPRAAAGTDPRGWLVFESLPTELQNAEDSTANADRERSMCGPHGFAFAEIPDPTRSHGVDSVTSRDAAAAAGLPRLRWLTFDGFVRDATDSERTLLEHLGHNELPELLYTTVTWPTGGLRNRRFTQLEGTTP